MKAAVGYGRQIKVKKFKKNSSEKRNDLKQNNLRILRRFQTPKDPSHVRGGLELGF
jgi:hypothetical protein